MSAGYTLAIASRCKGMRGGIVALAPKLEFRQSQQLVMTPQLQQAIKLLQLSNLELAEFVEEQLEENPFLERGENPDEGAPERRGEKEPEAAPTTTTSEVDLSSETPTREASESLDAEYEDIDQSGAGSDAAASDYRTNDWASAGSGGSFDGDDREFGATLSKEISLAEHLGEQLTVATRCPTELFIGAYLIDMIDEAGYLRDTLETVAERLGADLADVEATHKLITTFDPCGVGARDLKECLKLQLIDANRFDPAMQAFIENIELLAKADLKGLIKATQADEEDVRDMIAEVRALTPKPGFAFGGGTQYRRLYRMSSFESHRTAAGRLNSTTIRLPRVLVDQHYFAEISAASSDEKDKVFVSEQFANANWLAKSLGSARKNDFESIQRNRAPAGRLFRLWRQSIFDRSI